MKKTQGVPIQVKRTRLVAENNLPSSQFGQVNSCNGLIYFSGAERSGPFLVQAKFGWLTGSTSQEG